ncbi:MAG TPA: T9SS type A sorting domain-containing protein [Chitinophagales bacterium]|nr:T9SS type A sorting domain-containing protein [Chitinophagales bacterium]
MKKIYLLIPIFICLIGNANSQTPDWLWANAFGEDTGYDIATSLSIDKSGNVYATGIFNGTVDFDPGPGVFNLTSEGSSDIFISKSDSSGNLIWVKQMGGSNVNGEYAQSIAVDAVYNVYSTGYYYGTADFDPGAGTFNLSSPGIASAVYISKLDGSGNFVWAKAIKGTLSADGQVSNSIAIDTTGSGAIYTTGYFYGTADFDPGAALLNITSVSGSLDIFISKLDTAGNLVWVKTTGGEDNEFPFSMTLDPSVNGNFYLTGSFAGTADFDPGPGAFSITSAGWDDIFISKYDSSGNFIWAKAMGSTDLDEGYSIAVDPISEAVYTTGWFSAPADFDPGVGVYTLFSAGYETFFISKLDSAGNFVWAKAMDGTTTITHSGQSVAIDVSGNVYTSGWFRQTVDFDPDLGVFNLTSAGGLDIFISKFDSSGNFIWAKAMGGTTDDYAYSMVLNASGSVFLAGDFKSPSIDFGSTTLTNADNTGSTPDMFIAKLDTALSTGIKSITNDKGLSLYPNPASSHLTIALEGNSKKVEITITDFAGKIIYEDAVTGMQKTIEVNTNNFTEGVYFVNILRTESFGQTSDFNEVRKLIIVK